MTPLHKKCRIPVGFISLLLLTPISALYLKFTSPPIRYGLELGSDGQGWDEVEYPKDIKLSQANPPLAFELDTLKKFLSASHNSKYGLGMTRLFFPRNSTYQNFINIVDLLNEYDHTLLLHDNNFYIVRSNDPFYVLIGTSFEVQQDKHKYPFLESWWDIILDDFESRVMTEFDAIRDALSINAQYSIFLIYWLVMLFYSIFAVAHNDRRRLTSRSS